MHCRAYFLIGALIALYTAFGVAWAAQGILVVHVADPQDRPIARVQLSVKGIGSKGPPTDVTGKTRIRLAAGTKPGALVSLQVVSARDQTGKVRELVFISPWDARVRIPPFENETENFVPVVLAERGDRGLLGDGKALRAFAEKFNAATVLQAGKEITEADRKAVLAKVAQEHGLAPDEIDTAIRAWGEKLKDPYEKGLAALYEKNYSEATELLIESLKITERKLEEAQTQVVEFWMVFLALLAGGFLLLAYGFVRVRKFLPRPVSDLVARIVSFLRRSTAPESASEVGTITDMIVSDAAIHRIKEDRLGTSRLAKGLSLFLRNQNTQPPVTLAITGGWGAGKSSVMQMLKESLTEARYRPVWFNAWHHQHEEQLLGALLETIRQEGIPPIWRLTGIVFRLRLLARRAWRHALVSLVIIFTGLFVGLLWYFGVFSTDDLLNALKTPTKNLLVSTSVLAASLGVLISLHKGLSAFGVTPVQLARSMSHPFRSINLDTNPGLRYRVTQALGDITWALGRRTLVIFIDDLDRCPPEKVLKVLESVNFLSSTPCRSYIVLGMALDKVLPSISGEFHRVVEEGSKAPVRENEAQRDRRLKKERLAYARHYLEKMINIEINVPGVPTDKMEQLADETRNAAKERKTRKEQLNWLVRMADQRLFPVILAAAICFGLFFAAQHVAPPASPDTKDTTAAITAEQLDQTDKSAVKKSGTPEEIPATPTVRERNTWLSFALGVMVVFIGAVVASLLLARKAEIRDPPDFIEALKIWTEVITFNNYTPRHYKRALNQLRLLAMRMDDDNSNLDPESKNKRMVRFVVLKGLKELGFDAQEVLGIVKRRKYSAPVKADFKRNIKLTDADGNRITDNYAEVLSQAVARHRERFKEQWPIRTDIKHYDDLMQGITLH